MYRNYIFDLYGTLVDIHTDEEKDALWRTLCVLLAEQGVCYRPEELRMAYHGQVQLQARTLRRLGRAAEPEVDIGAVFRQLYAARGYAATDQEIATLARTFRRLSTEKLRLFDGTEQLLRELRERGKRIYLLSNAQALFTRPELDILHLKDAFDGILLSSEAGCKKPDSQFYRLMLERYRLRPEETLMVGNDDRADCHGAAAVGLDSCYIATEQSPVRRSPLPRRCSEISRITEVLSVGCSALLAH
ncbi:MAG: HAD family hydrolase [Clostridiales bacterium]|nr:HAD family hydrolase [Clostridiales bacterium]